MKPAPATRPGFTLIELLVVIVIITIVSGLLMLIAPALLKSEPASRGAQLLQGNLFIAKQQALRNSAPYGIRLLPDSDGQVRSFQFIQQPGDFTGGSITVQAASPTTATFANVDLSGGLTDPTLWPVQQGDYLQIQGGTLTLITAVTANSVTTKSNNPVTTTTDYRIIRAARPAAGEDTIFLPDDVIVDMGAAGNPPTGCSGSIITPDTRPNGLVYYDILFSPSGAVLGPAANSGKIILWVRDTHENYATDPDESLITVYTRNGLIASYPVDTSSTNPYSFTQNPGAGGL
jgi:prepilin-type N-terminal cleavage/methylation domain-containing protein